MLFNFQALLINGRIFPYILLLHIFIIQVVVVDLHVICEKNNYQTSLNSDETGNLNVLISLIMKWHWNNVILLTNQNEHTLLRQLSSLKITAAHFNLKPINQTLSAIDYYSKKVNNLKIIVSSEMEYQLQFKSSLPQHLLSGAHQWIYVMCPSENRTVLTIWNQLMHSLQPTTYVYTLCLSKEVFKIKPYSRNCHYKQVVLLASEIEAAEDVVFPVPILEFPCSLEGKNLTVAAHIPRLYGGNFFHVISQKPVHVEGFLVDFLDILADAIKFQYHFILSDTFGYGIINQSGQWTGLIGQVNRKEADLTGGDAGLFMTAERAAVCDFTPFHERTYSAVIFRKPPQKKRLSLQSEFMSYIKPFSKSVWLCGLGIVLIGMLILMLKNIFSLYFINRLNIRLINKIFLVLDFNLKTDGRFEFTTKLIVILLSVLTIYISCCYTAKLTSFLATKTKTENFVDLYELIRNNYEILMPQSTAIIDYVKNSKEEEFKAVRKSISKINLATTDFEIAVDNLYEHGRLAYFLPKRIAIDILQQNKSFDMLPTFYFPSTVHLCLQKHSPYTNILSKDIYLMRESGILKKIYKPYVESLDTEQENKKFFVVGIVQTVGPFTLLMIGILISLLCLTAEKFTAAGQKMMNNIAN